MPRTRWSLLNSFTEVIKKYKPDRRELANKAINNAFGLNGEHPLLWTSQHTFERRYKEIELARQEEATESNFAED